MLAVGLVFEPGKRLGRDTADSHRDDRDRSPQSRRPSAPAHQSTRANPSPSPGRESNHDTSRSFDWSVVPPEALGAVTQARLRRATTVALAALAVVGSGGRAPTAYAGPTERAVDYLAARQDPISGGFSSGDDVTAVVKPSYTEWAALAFVAAREDLRQIGAGPTLRAAVTDSALSASSTADISRSLQAVVAVGANPRSLRGRNLVAELRARQRPDATFDGEAFETAWGLLALQAAGLPATDTNVDGAIHATMRLQRTDGGWGPTGGESDPAVSSAAIQALVAGGVSPRDDALLRARTWLAGRQTVAGGIRPVGGGRADALTTAWTLLAVAALGDVPGAPPWDRGGGPRAYLLGLQRADGSFGYRPGQRAAPNWTTAIGAIAATRRALPIRPSRRTRHVDRRPVVVGRTPAAGSPFDGRLIIRVRDDRGGTGVDPKGVRLRVSGVDVTARARINGFAIEIEGLPTSTEEATPVELDLSDRAGNQRRLAWTLGPAPR